MSELDIVKQAVAEAVQVSPLVAGGVLESEIDLALINGQTVGGFIPGGIKTLKGRYAVNVTGEVTET